MVCALECQKLDSSLSLIGEAQTGHIFQIPRNDNNRQGNPNDLAEKRPKLEFYYFP